MKTEQLFRDENIGRTIIKTSVPAVFTITVMLIYNMVDMFFIGQSGDTSQVSAIALAGTLMAAISGLGTLLGSGGCAAIALYLGKGEPELAKKVSSFCCWFAVGLGVIFGAAILIFMPYVLVWTGAAQAGAQTAGFARGYLTILACAAPISMFSVSMSDSIRGEGAAKQSMIGTILGSVVNITLAPLFISAFGWGVTGAAIALVVGNISSAAYFVIYICGKKSGLSLNIRRFSLKPSISLKTLSFGLPTASGVLLMSLSSIVRNNLAVQYGDTVIAAMGVTGRVTMLVSMIQMGICSGVQPVIGYNYGAGNFPRMSAILKRVAFVTVVIGTALTALVFFGRDGLIRFFINDADVIAYGRDMTAVFIAAGPIFGISYLSAGFLQSTEKPFQATFVALLRQGVVLLPLSFAMDYFAGLYGLLWAGVITDVLATAISVVLFAVRYREIRSAK